MRVLRFVITNVKTEHEKDVTDALVLLVKKGIIRYSDVYIRVEETGEG